MKQGLRIGQILAEMGRVDRGAIEEAAAMRLERPMRLASRLRGCHGLDEGTLVLGLAAQKGLPGVVLSRSRLDLSCLGSIPREVAREGQFLPLTMEEGRLNIAFVNPDDRSLIDEITFVTGHDITPYVALQIAVDETLEQAYEAASKGTHFFGPSEGEVDAAFLERVSPPGPEVPPETLFPEDEEEIFSISVDVGDEPLSPPCGAGQPAGPSTADGGRRLLIVDDEPEILHLLGTALGRAGYDVETASRGLEALEKVRSFEPEVVVLDAMLPEVHGFEICRKIRSSRRFGHVPVLMISAVYRGWRFAQDVKDVYGASDFIEKPFRIGDVIARVAKALDGAEPMPETSDEAKQRAVLAYRRGVGMLKVGKVDEAVEAFQAGLESDPFSGALHFSLGRALHLKGEAYGAITAYQRAIELKPGLFPALKSLALIFESKGFLRKAIETWEQALPNAPDDAARRMTRERLLSLIEGGRAALERPTDLA